MTTAADAARDLLQRWVTYADESYDMAPKWNPITGELHPAQYPTRTELVAQTRAYLSQPVREPPALPEIERLIDTFEEAVLDWWAADSRFGAEKDDARAALLAVLRQGRDA